VVFALEDNKGWDRLTCRIDALDDCCPLLIALLDALRPSSTLRACNNRSSRYYAYHEARLVKAVHVFVYDAILRPCVLYKLKLPFNNLRILA
jgi:hypothetical protein